MLKELLKNNNIEEILDEIHGFDFASEFETLTQSEKESLFLQASNKSIANLLSYLSIKKAAFWIRKFETDKAVLILDEISSDDKIDILNALDSKTRRGLIAKLSDKEIIKELMLYDEDKTGAYTNYEIIKIDQDLDVKQATKILIKQAPDVESISTIFIVDSHNQYQGILSFKTLLKTKSPMKVLNIMEYLKPANISDDIEITIQSIKNYKVYEMPVVNDNNELLGMVTSDDAIDIVQEEGIEDFEKLAALPKTTKERTIKASLHRLPWLITLVLLSIPIALLTTGFSKELAGIAILVVFQPIMLGTPGNIATQTLAVTLSELSEKGKINFKHFLKEFLSGLFTAIILTITAFIFAFAFMMIKKINAGDNQLLQGFVKTNTSSVIQALIFALILSISLFIVIVVAPIIAVLIPAFLKLIKQDPAVASGPFITTIIDVSSVAIYFSLTLVMLRAFGGGLWN